MTKPIANNTAPISGEGGELEVSLDSGTTYVLIPEVQEIPGIIFNGESQALGAIDKIDQSQKATSRTVEPYVVTFDRLASNATQDAVLAAARSNVESEKTLPCRWTRRTGDVTDFNVEWHGHGENPSARGTFDSNQVGGFIDVDTVVYSKVA